MRHCSTLFTVFLIKNMAVTRSLVGILSSNNLKFLSSRTIQTSSIRAFSVCDNCIHSNGLYGKSILTKSKINSGKVIAIMVRSLIIFGFVQFNVITGWMFIIQMRFDECDKKWNDEILKSTLFCHLISNIYSIANVQHNLNPLRKVFHNFLKICIGKTRFEEMQRNLFFGCKNRWLL